MLNVQAWALLLSLSGILSAQSVTIAGYPTPGQNNWRITAGPDGAMWFTDLTNAIGRISTSGSLARYPIPTSNSGPYGIAAGPDGNLWFTELFGNKIGRITTSGVITEFPIQTAYAAPWDIAAGPDGALWFTESGSLYHLGSQVAKIGRITTNGLITEWSLIPSVPLSTPSTYPQGITAGPDGALWFTEGNTGTIGRITTAGSITRFGLPTRINRAPNSITAGPDGALWFTEQAANQIGRITTAGEISEYAIPATNTTPYAITAGSDGALWFVGSKLGRITIAGQFSEYGGGGSGIAAGPDRNVWFTEHNQIKSAILATLATVPTIAAVTNTAAPYAQTIQSNSWVTIYGSGLAPAGSTRTWGAVDIVNGKLPSSLGGVSVTINSKPAYVEYISPTQINVLAPNDTATGTVNVVVINQVSSAVFPTQIATYSPAFFTFPTPNARYIAAILPFGSGGTATYLAPVGALGASTSSQPATAGEIVELYGTGFGPVNPAPPDGQVFFGAYPSAGLVTVTIGGLDAIVAWSGLSSAGLYQLNVIVPAGLPSGDALVVATAGGIHSQGGTFIPIQQ